MAVLNGRDVFDFDDYFSLIKSLEGETDRWGEGTIAWLTRIRATYDSTRKEVADLLAQIGNINVANKDAANVVNNYATKVADATGKLETARQAEIQLTQAREINNKVVVDLTNQLLALKQRYDNLDPTQKGYKREQQAILTETRNVTRAIDAQSKSLRVGKMAIDATEDSFTHLKKQTNDLKRSLDHMAGAYDKSTGKINQQNKAAVALNAQYQKNLAVIRKVEAGQGIHNRNVGNYPKGPNLSGIGSSMLMGAGAMVGITSGFDALQKVGDITLQFDSLDAALKVVSNDTDLFTRRQAMLKQVSDDLGQDLSVVEEQYTAITASSLNTRLEGAATDKIFTQIVGTLGRLHRPADQVQRALLAVGQMMSKGTVQSEELKGQLGEILPGSFSVAARSIGVTTSKLSDMLQKGEVVASEFLPKFAQELENSFNPRHEQRVESLAANLARLRNEGVEWVKSLDMGDSMSRFVGWITLASQSIRGVFGSAVDSSTDKLAKQKDAVNQLESTLSGLLTRYDELKNKTNLSAAEQKELQSVINDLAGLVPSAATGFDQYGNALDINKGKVMSYTQAQRELNAELNKQVIKDLTEQANKQVGGTKFLQNNLKQGVKVRNNSLGATDMTEADKRKAAEDLRSLNQQAQTTIKQIIANGGTVEGELRKYIQSSGDYSAQQMLIIDDTNKKIAAKQAEAAVLFQKGSFKQREVVVKEVAKLQGDLNQLANPSLAEKKAPPKDDYADQKRREKEEAARKKRQAEADRKLNASLSVNKAGTDNKLAVLGNDRQDGLISEQDFIERRLKITLDGAHARLSLLQKAGKQESDDYKKVLSEKQLAETEYKRAQLKLDLQNSKSRTENKLSSLSEDKNGGDITELDYTDQRHKAVVAGIEEQQRILEEAGQKESDLYRGLHADLLEENATYLKQRVQAEHKSWKDQIEITKDSLKVVDETVSGNLSTRLNELENEYTKQRAVIEKAVAGGKMGEGEGDQQLYDLQMRYLDDSMRAAEAAYDSDRNLSKALLDQKLADLAAWKEASTRTPAEIADVEKLIADLRKAVDEDLAEDKKDRAEKTADFIQKKSEETGKKEVENARKAMEARALLWQKGLDLAQTIGDATFSITNNSLQRESDNLEKNKEHDLKLAGDSTEAKEAIEADYAKKKAELQRKQAIADREQAIFNIAMNTAMGVASVLSTGGGTRYADFGVSAGLLTAFVIATGAIQAAAILAQPLPSFWKGVSSAPEGMALVGDRGPEIRQGVNGQLTYYDRPTVDYLNKGDRIYTAGQTARLVEDWQRQEATLHAQQVSSLNKSSIGRLQEGRVQEQVLIHKLAGSSGNSQLSKNDYRDGLAEALANRPEQVTEWAPDGVHSYVRTKTSQIEYRNKRRLK